MQRFVASDVIWEDLFKEPTKNELDNLDITGVNVPGSVFLRNPDIATTASMKSVWQRIHGAATGGANCSPRGTGIVSTKVLPTDQELSTTTHEHDPALDRPDFSVTIKNSGCAQESASRSGSRSSRARGRSPLSARSTSSTRATRRPWSSATSACRSSTRRRR